MKRTAKQLALALLLVLISGVTSRTAVTVKVRDLVYIDGFRENQVLGFGIVVGLPGTGDTKSVLTDSSLKNVLKNLGLNSDDAMPSKNTAAVLLTAKLPPFARIGDRVEIMVSSVGNAKSLEGGILVQSPLRAADDKIYIVAQGPLTMSKAGKNSSGVKTVATVVNGGLVERNIEPDFITENTVNIVLREWDFSVANQIITAVKDLYPQSNPEIARGGKIKLAIPRDVLLTEFISKIEDIDVTPLYRSRVVINERDGTIVTGGDVKISEAMVSREGLVIQIKSKAGSETDSGESKKGSAVHMKDTATIKDLVDTLNFAGASTRDTISILRALKDSGALHAELVIK